jgi:hypothetical protein
LRAIHNVFRKLLTGIIDDMNIRNLKDTLIVCKQHSKTGTKFTSIV